MGVEKFPARGSVSRSSTALASMLRLLRVTDPRSGIRVNPCPSVVELFFHFVEPNIEPSIQPPQTAIMQSTTDNMTLPPA